MYGIRNTNTNIYKRYEFDTDKGLWFDTDTGREGKGPLPELKERKRVHPPPPKWSLDGEEEAWDQTKDQLKGAVGINGTPCPNSRTG